LNRKKHWKFRTGRAEAAFNLIRRLTRLPPEEKRKVVIGQLLPILAYHPSSGSGSPPGSGSPWR